MLHVDPAAGIAETAADLTGTIDPRNLPASAWFEYWPANSHTASGENRGPRCAQRGGARRPGESDRGPPAGQGLSVPPRGDRRPDLRTGPQRDAEPAHGRTAASGRRRELQSRCRSKGRPPPNVAGEQDFSKLAAPKQVTLDCEVDTTSRNRFADRVEREQRADPDGAVLGRPVRPRPEGGRQPGRGARPGRRQALRETEIRASTGAFSKRARKGSGGRKLWGSGSGNYKTVGSHGAATVRGTIWLVSDRCDGSTHFKVKKGHVVVRDFVKTRNR